MLVQDLCFENEFHLHENEAEGELIFRYEWFLTYTRFDAEAKRQLGNALFTCINNSYLCELLTGSRVGVFLQSSSDEEQNLSLLCASGEHFRNLEPLW